MIKATLRCLFRSKPSQQDCTESSVSHADAQRGADATAPISDEFGHLTLIDLQVQEPVASDHEGCSSLSRAFEGIRCGPTWALRLLSPNPVQTAPPVLRQPPIDNEGALKAPSSKVCYH